MRTTPRRAAFATAAAAAAAADGPVGFSRRVAAIPALVRDVLLGRYDGLSRRRLLLMVLALLYVVSPVDLLPEAILTIPGLADDAVVGGWLVTAVLAASGGYTLWRDGRLDPADGASVVPGVVIPSA
jgi:uncharacterized membrane protein YkvA (DUF1232 family)